MLLLDNVSDFSHSDSMRISKLWLSRAWFGGFCDQNSFESQIARGKKVKAFSQGTDDSKNLKRETLYIVKGNYVNISSFAVLDIKLWLEKDSELDTDRPLSSFKFINQRLNIGTKCSHILAIILYPT